MNSKTNTPNDEKEDFYKAKIDHIENFYQKEYEAIKYETIKADIIADYTMQNFPATLSRLAHKSNEKTQLNPPESYSFYQKEYDSFSKNKITIEYITFTITYT